MAFGGPNEYKGRSIAAGHAKLVKYQGLNDSHFNAIGENLVKTLEELNVPQHVIKQIGAIAESTREDVLGRNKA
jgi:hemoglobin